jgi:SAM-dependent methyltransferase
VLLAQDFGLRVAGLDLSAANVALAQGRADAEGLAGRVWFTVGDAERLPYPNSAFDAVVVECALCTFPNKRAAASEIARVLRPSGKLGLTDVLADPPRLPAELTTLTARIACVADALPLRGYADLLHDAGLDAIHTERHDTAVTRMIDHLEARLAVLRLTARARFEEIGLDIDRARFILSTARAAVNDGILGYGLLVAEKPT